MGLGSGLEVGLGVVGLKVVLMAGALEAGVVGRTGLLVVFLAVGFGLALMGLAVVVGSGRGGCKS